MQGTAVEREQRLGLFAAVGAFSFWGVIGAYYKLTASVPAGIVVCYRIVSSVLVIGLFLAVRRRLPELWAALRDRHIVRQLGISGALIGGNWLVFIWAVENDRMLEASLGYYINPLVSVALGLVVLGERLTRLQMAAIMLAVLAVAVRTVFVGGLPWVSLALAFSFAAYGYMRKMTAVGSTPGLMVETLLLAPLAGVALVWSAWSGTHIAPLADPWLLLALAGTGPVTAVPLILFGIGARRLPLTSIALLQYIAPSLMIAVGVSFGEPLTPATVLTFVLIWLALGVFTVDLLRHPRIPPPV